MNKLQKLKKVEFNDVRCALTLLNVVLVLLFGVSFAWIGLAVAVFGIAKDIVTRDHINSYIIHAANMIMYCVLLFKA